MLAPKLKVEIIGYDCGWGCKDYGCEDGPTALSADKILSKLHHMGIEGKWRGPLGIKFLGKHSELNSKEKTLPLVLEGLKRLFNHVKYAVENKAIPIIIGGDHSSAVGTWAGSTAALHAEGKFGLIWVDAHMDSHTYQTSHEGKWGGWWHGQPVAALLGHGLSEFKEIGGAKTKLSPEHISMIGIHSFEPAEEAFVKKHNIKVYYLDEVKKRGFKAVYTEALERAQKGTVGFGLTIDLDAFDPSEAPGVGAQETKGLFSADVLPIIKSAAYLKGFTALEIAELNPHLDKNNKTVHLVEKIIESVFATA